MDAQRLCSELLKRTNCIGIFFLRSAYLSQKVNDTQNLECTNKQISLRCQHSELLVDTAGPCKVAPLRRLPANAWDPVCVAGCREKGPEKAKEAQRAAQQASKNLSAFHLKLGPFPSERT